MSHFYAYLSKMKFIKRWGLMRNVSEENIQEHSLQVAMIAHCLAIIKNKLYGGNLDPQRALTLAVFHESSEVITGDLAAPIKYFNPEIKGAYKSIEKIANKKLLDMLPEFLKEDFTDILFPKDNEKEYWKIVKAADKISAYIKCIEELKAGNQEFSKAEKSIRKELEEYKNCEVEYFMNNFMPSFYLTLDELN